MRTREQRYAAEIFGQVSAVADRPAEYRSKYGSMAHKLPVLIRSAGLAQALAFVEARGEDPHRDLLEHLAKVTGQASKDTLLRRSREAELGEYMRLTQAVLAALVWYKRFAQSVLEVESAGEETEG